MRRPDVVQASSKCHWKIIIMNMKTMSRVMLRMRAFIVNAQFDASQQGLMNICQHNRFHFSELRRNFQFQFISIFGWGVTEKFALQIAPEKIIHRIQIRRLNWTSSSYPLSNFRIMPFSNGNPKTKRLYLLNKIGLEHMQIRFSIHIPLEKVGVDNVLI